MSENVDDSEIRPALTAEEWRQELDGERLPILPGPYATELFGTPHWMAALALYKQPFGFTQDDVATVRAGVLALMEGDCPLLADELQSVLDRIAALLPPEPS